MGFPLRFPVRALLLGALAFCFLALNLALALFASKMYPVERGTAEEFWDAMYHLELSRSRSMGGVYPTQGDLCIYYQQGFHGQFLHSVPAGDVARMLPEVRVQALKRCEFLSARERQLLESEASISDLINARYEARIAKAAERSKEDVEYLARCQEAFLARWSRIRHYWANILFEGIYLNASLAMIWIPFLKKDAHVWRGLSAGLALPLLMTPYFLGYCPWAFTSAGPVGGVLYPFLLGFFRRWPVSWNALDISLIEWLNGPLEPLSQGPGEMMSVSGGGAVSPTSAIIVGLILGACAFAASRAIGKAVRERQAAGKGHDLPGAQ